jgi:uncharacterized protein YndB with AHSA1/START domain
MNKEIKHVWFFSHPPEIIWEYLTDSELLSQWLMKNDFKPIVGHAFSFNIAPVPALELDGIIYCEVLEISPHKKISYSWKFGPAPGVTIVDSQVVWTLTPKEGGTELLLIHSGFKDLREIPAYDAMNAGWQTNVNKIHILIAKKEKNEHNHAS